MDKRLEVNFVFQGKSYVANVLIKENEKGYDYIINLFDRQLNKDFKKSYTFIVKDNRFLTEKPMSKDQLELINAIKEALRNHPHNTYIFTTDQQE
jgi:hypothetical protein